MSLADVLHECAQGWARIEDRQKEPRPRAPLEQREQHEFYLATRPQYRPALGQQQSCMKALGLRGASIDSAKFRARERACFADRSVPSAKRSRMRDSSMISVLTRLMPARFRAVNLEEFVRTPV